MLESRTETGSPRDVPNSINGAFAFITQLHTHILSPAVPAYDLYYRKVHKTTCQTVSEGINKLDPEEKHSLAENVRTFIKKYIDWEKGSSKRSYKNWDHRRDMILAHFGLAEQPSPSASHAEKTQKDLIRDVFRNMRIFIEEDGQELWESIQGQVGLAREESNES